MNVLLDTTVALWALSDPDRLGPRMRAVIESPRNQLAVSAVTVWEVEIKRALGKLDAPDGFAAVCVERDFEPLDVTFAHAERAGRLPLHHADPFDRMLIGQALCEDYRIATADTTFLQYGVATLDALE